VKAPLLSAVIALTACGAGQGAAVRPKSQALHESRWSWLDATCSDGSLELGGLGLERTLTVEVTEGALRLTHETQMLTEGCRVLDVWSALPGKSADLWRFVPEVAVALPPEAECGPAETEPVEGTLRLRGDVLEIVTRRSAWCRGFDARFTYRRSDPAPASPEGLAARYVAHWNRADAAAVARLFVAEGSLIEPFTRTQDGRYARHGGRAQVQAWLGRAFASTGWHAMRLLSVERAGGEGQWAFGWEYVDERLAAPLRGRNLFVVAGGAIFETEVQLLTDPQPRAQSSTPPGNVDAAPETTP
jgi:hypothetical protein